MRSNDQNANADSGSNAGPDWNPNASRTPNFGRDSNRSSGGSSAPVDPLRAPIATFKGVAGSRERVDALRRLGIFRAFDLLFYFPRDYLEIKLKTSLAELTEDETQSICGTIENYRTKFAYRGPIVTLDVAVGDEILQAVWFNQRFITSGFAFGRRLMLTGKPKLSGRYWQMTHPKLTYLSDSNDDADFNDAESKESGEVDENSENNGCGENLTVEPIYSLTEGMTQYRLCGLIKRALETLPDLLPEALPAELRAARDLPSIADAIRKIHRPANLAEAERARRRFAYQEALVLQLALAICRTRRRVGLNAPELPRDGKIDARIRSLFPFELTDAQNAAIAEISADMGRPTPMNRLLQGDVGSGKTVVAAYAMLQAVANGAQAALMAPTETLARQHLRTLTDCLRNSATKVVPLFGGQKPAERAAILEQIRTGEARIVVGTQALAYGEIAFKRLGLVVVDEQHKFGVRQRASLKSASTTEPHYLAMSATPIPRSLTMTVFGDLDVSTMRGTPPGRRKTTTAILDAKNRASWWAFVREKLREGRQAYVVVPRIESESTDGVDYSAFVGREVRKIENDGTYSADFDFWNSWEGPAKERSAAKRATSTLNGAKEAKNTDGMESASRANNAEEANDGDEEDGEKRVGRSNRGLKNVWSVYKELSEGELKGFRLGIVRGNMSTEEKEAAMLDFRCGNVQVLIATSVIEVGIDVPNATLMTIENAERFGLAQLHQLRGRIGRGKYPGFCAVAPTEYPDSALDSDSDELNESNDSNRFDERGDFNGSVDAAKRESDADDGKIDGAPPAKGGAVGKTDKTGKAGKKIGATKRKKTAKTAKSDSAKSDAEALTAEEKRRAAIRERLEFFARTSDGFALAEKDFELRGPGELFGARQHGAAAFRVVDLVRDRELVEEAREDARKTIAADPGLLEPEHAALRKQTTAKYGKTFDLGDVG